MEGVCGVRGYAPDKILTSFMRIFHVVAVLASLIYNLGAAETYFRPFIFIGERSPP